MPTINVNGEDREFGGDPNTPLLWYLRDELSLTGTKYGCGEGACGACSVIVDGRRRFSCSTLITEVSGKSITTIEGLASGETLHPIQKAFLEHGAFQCGYCTAGMIVNTCVLLKSNPNPSEQEVCQAMNGNICRCCTHPEIVSAIRKASELAKG